jgi:ribonuclease R
MDELNRRVLAFIAEPDYQPITLKALSKRLKVGEEGYADLRSVIKGLIKSGQVELGKDKAIHKSEPSDHKGNVVGTFRRTSKGFGFVRPAQGTGAKSEQIFIPVDAGRDASSGDEVLVRLIRKAKGPGYNAEGRIVQVINRASGLFVGTYFERGDAGMVKIDGTTFRDPIYVGDPGAKGAIVGDKVALEMVRYPTPYREGEGVITEVLGARGQPGVDTLAIIRALGIPDKFDDETLDDARQAAKAFREDDMEGRLDLTGNLTITIDPATARDFDDAITLTRDERGYWSLGVHIADVSHFVRPGSALDRTARLRGTSVYLPDRVIPMLPEILSNSLASLQAGHVRYTVSALIEFSADGVRTDRSFARSAIRVDQRFAYEQVMPLINEPDTPAEGVSDEVRATLVRMHELAMLLRKRRFARGALELNMPEVEVDLGENGEVVGAHLASHDESHQVIEEFMLAANEAVASYLTEKGVGFLRRAHADPEPRKLKEFADFARSLGLVIENPQSRFELQRVLAETADAPEAYAVHFGLLRSLKQAVYTPEPEGHYALASDDYCHFTSPIRRYPDLQVHRQLTSLLVHKKPKTDFEELTVLAEHCTRTERRAEIAERELIKVKLLTFLETKVGETFHAILVGVEDFGLFARLVELPAEGMIHVTSLADDFYYLEGGTHTLVGRASGRRYRLGDRVEFIVARVDIDRRELDLIPADNPSAVASPRPAARPRPTRGLNTLRPARGRPERPATKGKPKGKAKGKRKKG